MSSHRKVVVVVWSLCLGFSFQFGEEIGLALLNASLTLLEGKFLQSPSLLGDLLGGLLSWCWIGANAGVSLLVDALDLKLINSSEKSLKS